MERFAEAKAASQQALQRKVDQIDTTLTKTVGAVGEVRGSHFLRLSRVPAMPFLGQF